MSQTPEQNPASTPSDLGRRTILQGAAWTIPAITVAAVAPAAAAASNTVALTFNQSTYTGTACSTITGAFVTVTVNGTPTAGRSVTTTLSGGYTFTGASTTNTQVSDTNGRVNLPAINVPAVGGTASATAVLTGASTATTTLASANSSTGAYYKIRSGNSTGYASVPSNAKPLAANYFLAPNGGLYYGNSLVDTNVLDATGYYGGAYGVVYTKSGGGYTRVGSGAATNFSSVPSDAKPLAALYFLAPNGNLYYQNTMIATKVVDAIGYFGSANGVVFTKATGGFLAVGTGITGYPAVPSNSKPLFSGYFLAPNGDLYFGNGKMDSSVLNARGWYGSKEGIDYTKASGGVFAVRESISATFPSVPSDSTPLGAQFYLTPDSKLYFQNAVVDTNVAAAHGFATGDTLGVDYTRASAC